MANKFKGVANTLFIPLAARIYVSKKYPEYFYDEKAIELEDSFSLNEVNSNSSEYTYLASAARYYNMDKITEEYLKSHDKCNICFLGCGLETMYFRLTNHKEEQYFYEVDLPEVIEARRQVLGENKNEKLIPGSLFDLSWADNVDKSLPTLFVVSGVFQYFHNEEILKFIEDSKKIFKDCEMVFDATNSTGIKYCIKYVKKTGNKDAMMYSYVDDPKEWSKDAKVELISSCSFYNDARKIIGKKVEFYSRIAMFVVDHTGRAIILHVKLI